MDIAVLAALAILGGFIPLRSLVWLRYDSEREDSQRLYYKAALTGLFLALIGYRCHVYLATTWVPYQRVARDFSSALIVPLLEKVPESPASVPAPSPQTVPPVQVSRALQVRADIAVACVWALLLASLSPFLNLPYVLVRWLVPKFRPTELVERKLSLSEFSRHLHFVYRHRATKNEFDLLLLRCLLEERPVQITLLHGKVYVGVIVMQSVPGATRSCFQLQPYFSGFRNQENGTVAYTTSYLEVLNDLATEARSPEEKLAAGLRVESFRILLFAEQVVSFSGFDIDAHIAFQLKKASPPDEVSTNGIDERVGSDSAAMSEAAEDAATHRAAPVTPPTATPC